MSKILIIPYLNSMAIAFANQRFICIASLLLICLCACSSEAFAKVTLGIEVLLEDGHLSKLKHKRIGLITNQTAVDSKLKSTFEILRQNAKEFKIAAIFAPEHG